MEFQTDLPQNATNTYYFIWFPFGENPFCSILCNRLFFSCNQSFYSRIFKYNKLKYILFLFFHSAHFPDPFLLKMKPFFCARDVPPCGRPRFLQPQTAQRRDKRGYLFILFMNCPRLCRQYKKRPAGGRRKKNQRLAWLRSHFARPVFVWIRSLL